MKKNKLSAVEKFQRDLKIAFELYYRQRLSDRAKESWKKRKKLSTSNKVVM